ncbi:MAG: hypothetical protein ACYC48_03300, partial [Minisyncoccota bacterium]
SLASTILMLANGTQTTTLTSSQAGVVHVNATANELDPNVVAVTFTGATVPDIAVLKVSGIDAINTYATTGGNFDNGFKWTFHVTVPTGDTQFAMKFSDFSNGTSGVIPAANNIRFYSPQSSDASTPGSARMITTAGTYSQPIMLSTDLDPSTAGRQIEVTVEMQVPTGTPGGSYSASYGIDSGNSVVPQ